MPPFPPRLQQSRAYSILANNGARREISMTATESLPEATQVADPELVKSIRGMLKTAVGEKGTGKRAMIDGYSVGGKTGTVHKVKASGGYDPHRYMSVFAGLSPVDDPRLVTIVVIDEPREGDYFGGLVAAPVFSEVTGNALRLLQVSPDNMDVDRNIASVKAMLAKRGNP